MGPYRVNKSNSLNIVTVLKVRYVNLPFFHPDTSLVLWSEMIETLEPL